MAANSEQKSRYGRDAIEATLFERSKGRCECDGLCGHNHVWDPQRAPQRCNAAHGINVVRKKGHPSCVWNAPIQGFSSQEMTGPRTHARGKYVVQGAEVPGGFAFPEHFEMDKITQIWLSVVRVKSGGSPESHKLMCQFCIHQARKKGALPS